MLVKPVKQPRLFDCLISQVRSRAEAEAAGAIFPPRILPDRILN